VQDFKLITEKIYLLRDKVESFERNFIKKTYYSDKKIDTLLRCDDKIEKLMQINSEKIFTIKTRDKEFNVSENQINECPFKSILFNKFIDQKYINNINTNNDTIFIDIGSKYVKYTLELMRKLIIREKAKSKNLFYGTHKVKIIISFTKDQIIKETLISFICYFFNQISKEELFSNVYFDIVHKYEPLFYEAPIKFFTESYVRKISLSNVKEQNYLKRLLNDEIQEQFFDDGSLETNFFGILEGNEKNEEFN